MPKVLSKTYKTNITQGKFKFFQNKKRINNCEVITIQVLAETEYQDLYRVTDGVLLVVNKFKLIDYSKVTNKTVGTLYRAKTGKYNKGCQNCLKVLKSDYVDTYSDVTVPKGTVLYNGRPVIATKNEEDFRYEIKTTGSSFSGDSYEINRMLTDILYQIKLNEYDAK